METNMRKVVLAISMALAVIFVPRAHGGTIHVFAEYIGGASYSSPGTERQAAYASFLEDNDIDFGVFYGPSSSGNFGFSHADYTKSSGSSAGGTGGYHIFVYKTARWQLLKRYSMSTASNKKNSADACVVEDKNTGEQFIFLMPSGNTFPYVNSGSAIAPVTGMRSSSQSEYPNARLIVGVSLTYGIFSDSKLDESIIAWGCTEARSGTSGGAIYAQNHESRTALSAGSVSWLTGAVEPAATATITYRHQVTISFEDWDGTSLGVPQTVYVGEDVVPPADPTRTGYHFTGWSGSYENVQASATLVAQYNPDMFTVRFLDWNGDVLKSELVAYEEDATPPDDPTREGFRFLGWSGTYTGIVAATDITALYADAGTVTHWVTFNDWDGTQLSRQEILEGEDATPPASPDTKTGYHFTGWSGNYANVQQDETVTAVYAINTYTITFQDWDESVLKVETVDYGADATPPADPERTGYTFAGWQGTYLNVAADAAVVAQYNINTYTVTFQYTNGVVIVQQTVDYLGSATKPANPAPIEENTVFYRWDGAYTSITEDTTVNAIFVPTVIEIGTGAEFAEYMGSSLVSLSGVTFALTNDISLSGVTYSKPSEFLATIDGRGYTLRNFPSHKDIKALCSTLKGTIRNLCIAGYNSPGNIGLTSLIAGSANGAYVSGVVLSNCTWTIPNASQGSAGFFYSASGGTTITNCTMFNCRLQANNATRGEQYLGGFVGSASNLRMVDCHFIVENTNVVSVGGQIPIAGALVGQCGNAVTIERCSNNGRVSVQSYVSAQDGSAGGLVGKATSNSGSPTISDCANFGAVETTVNTPAGGIIGNVGTASGTFSFTLKNCFNYGDVSSPLAAGGLIGRYRGVISALINDGNSGAVFSDTGFAGGLVGKIRYNDDNRTWRIVNALQAGSVSTENGFAGIVVGGIEGSTGSGLSMVVSNVFMAGSAVATEGGQTGLAIGGCDAESTGELSLAVSGGGVLNSNAALQPGYDAEGQPIAWTGEAPSSFAPTALVDMTILAALNVEAKARSVTRWISGEEFPELETFGIENSPGMIMMCW